MSSLLGVLGPFLKLSVRSVVGEQIFLFDGFHIIQPIFENAFHGYVVHLVVPLAIGLGPTISYGDCLFVVSR